MTAAEGSRENLVVLQAVQAAIGLISPEIAGISVEVKQDRAILHFAVDRSTEELAEDVDDIIFELDALLEGSELLESRVYVGAADLSWPGRAGRLIYMAKPR